jgi:hypothetical protein
MIGLSGLLGFVYKGQTGAIFGLLLGILPAWLWWSALIARWREWAKLRGADERQTQRLGERSGLVWPKGSVFRKLNLKLAKERKLHAPKSRLINAKRLRCFRYLDDPFQLLINAVTGKVECSHARTYEPNYFQPNVDVRLTSVQTGWRLESTSTMSSPTNTKCSTCHSR